MQTYLESNELDLISAGVCTDDERWGIDAYIPRDLLDTITFGWSFGMYSGVVRLSLLFVDVYVATPFIRRR